MEESRKEGECCIMIVTIGSGGTMVTLVDIINWDESKTHTIYKNANVGVSGGGTAIKDSVITKPKRITLTLRLTSTEEIALETLQAQHEWQPLNDDSTLIDYVWMESIRPRWKAIEHFDRPWLTDLGLIASAG